MGFINTKRYHVNFCYGNKQESPFSSQRVRAERMQALLILIGPVEDYVFHFPVCTSGMLSNVLLLELLTCSLF